MSFSLPVIGGWIAEHFSTLLLLTLNALCNCMQNQSRHAKSQGISPVGNDGKSNQILSLSKSRNTTAQKYSFS